MLEKITEAEINERSMARVSTTPGRKTGFGENNLNPEALKLRFDRLGRFLAGKINEILGSIEDGSIAEYIYVDHNGNKISVEQFITNLLNGDVDNIQIKINGGIVYLTEIAMKTEEMYNGLFTGDIAEKIAVVDGITLKRFYEDFLKFEANAAPVKSVNGKTGHVQLSAPDLNAEVLGTAQARTERHNTSDASHADIRSALANLVQRLDALANSEDTDLDQLKEIVAYIKENKNLIDGVTASKVNVSDIIDNLETNLKDKPLSASQGVALKNMIAEITPFTKLSELDNDVGFITEKDVPVRNVNGKTGEVTLDASDVGAEAAGTVNQHNADTAAHNDLRLLIQGLTARLNALANSDDTDLDQLKEIVAYIKLNKDLIDGITTSKVNIADIIDNLTTNVTNKPLSAAQGVALKALIDALQSGKLNASELSTAINTALAQAKASGEFDGAPGSQGIQGYSIVASVDRPSFTTAHWDTYGEIGHAENWGGTSNAGVRVGDIFLVVGTATDTGIGHMLVYKYTGEKGGNTLSGQCLAHHIVAYRGAKGNDGKDGEDYIITDDDKEEIVAELDTLLTAEVETEVEQQLDGAKADIVTELIKQIGGLPVFGTVDENNVITTTTRLFNGTYVLRYKDENNTYSELAEFTVTGGAEDVITYTVTNNLIACKTSNDATTANSNTGYHATITPDTGYTGHTAIQVKMGGVDISSTAVSGDNISIDKVDGDIVISCIGYKTDVRLSLSGGSESAQTGTETTGYIPVTKNSSIRIKNVACEGDTTRGVCGYYEDDNGTIKHIKDLTGENGGPIATMFITNGYDDGNGVRRSQKLSSYPRFNNDKLAYIRLCSTDLNETSIITVDEPIV